MVGKCRRREMTGNLEIPLRVVQFRAFTAAARLLGYGSDSLLRDGRGGRLILQEVRSASGQLRNTFIHRDGAKEGMREKKKRGG